MTQAELQAHMLKQLHAVAVRLPNGLLHRLVEDARFFHDWNQGKKRARRSARLAQQRTQINRAEERYWRENGRG